MTEALLIISIILSVLCLILLAVLLLKKKREDGGAAAEQIKRLEEKTDARGSRAFRTASPTTSNTLWRRTRRTWNASAARWTTN